MNRVFLAIIIVISLTVGIGISKYLLQTDSNIHSNSNQQNSSNTDPRKAIKLNNIEQNMVLEEMRGFLNSTQKIVAALADDDMSAVVAAAKESGRASQEQMPAETRNKLPEAFKKLGFDTHTKFDQLAMDADDMEDSQQTLVQLSELMQNCIACHATFRIEKQ
jgi:mono/diheme cytochrome c family protein